MSVTNSQYGFITTARASTRYGTSKTDCKHEVVMAINKSKSEQMDVGIAILDFGTYELTLMEFCDTSLFVRTVHQIDTYQPTIVIAPEGPSMQFEKLRYILASNLDKIVEQRLAKARRFDASNGMEYLKSHSHLQNSELFESITDRKLSIGAASALFTSCLDSKLLKQTSKVKIGFVENEKFMLIDSGTIRNLELVSSLNGDGTTVFSFLNRCTTKMGQRLLRTSIIQPLTNVDSIKLRLESVTELISQETILIRVKYVLKRFPDLDKLFASFLNPESNISQEQMINNILLLKSTLSLCGELLNCLDHTESPLFVQVSEILKHENIETALLLIDKYIDENCRSATKSIDIAHQRANAVKSGINGLLDVSRSVREAILEQVTEYVQKVSMENNVAIEYRYDKSRGFYLKIKGIEIDNPEFINIIKRKNGIECTTIDLLKQSSRLNEIMAEINNISSIIISDLYEQSCENAPIFFMISEAIATVDLLCCFADFISSQSKSYVCPEFGKYIHVRQSRHPIFEKFISDFVPNDYSCVPEISRFQIITGANMSGKSVYLKQIAYILIMSQMGLYVPADYATIKLHKSILSRISSDTTDVNVSSFSNEMTDICRILRNADQDSFVIIDELGRGSSLRDGFSICLAILEHLITTGASVFTTTHFREIAEILGSKSCVLASHMKMTESNGKLESKFKLEPGKLELECYGIKYAESSLMLPAGLLMESKSIAETLKLQVSKCNDLHSKLVSRRRKLVLELYFALNQMRVLDCSASYKLDLLRTLQAKFVEEINDVSI
ncbi:MSH4 [Candida margitis]|uniref:MSH4 n=1 Tax=Candida margitis TaxID=1775924 RepID=UPI002227ACDA|nr:MSH4 [Candida margitis]KAI5955391.1 MSH4 [Candida margitis]